MLVDTTLATTDDLPASVAVRVLWEPTAVADSGLTTLEDTLLAGAAPGVLANDIEPNEFTKTISSYTQPSHGSVTMTSTGGYTYSPSLNYNGTDSFTYTFSNGNGRQSTASVSLSVTAVNDRPTFTQTSALSVLEDAAPQTVVGWATAMSSGPADESSQGLSFNVFQR